MTYSAVDICQAARRRKTRCKQEELSRNCTTWRSVVELLRRCLRQTVADLPRLSTIRSSVHESDEVYAMQMAIVDLKESVDKHFTTRYTDVVCKVSADEWRAYWQTGFKKKKSCSFRSNCSSHTVYTTVLSRVCKVNFEVFYGPTWKTVTP